MANEAINYPTDTFGVHDPLPFPIGEARASADFPELDKLVGSYYRGKNGFACRLVRLNIPAGLDNSTEPKKADCRAFARTLETTDVEPPVYDVELALRGGTKPINRTCGFTIPGQAALVDNDLFFLVVKGPYIWVKLGDDDTDVAIGDYINLDDDVDKGNVYGVSTTISAEFTLGVAMDTRTGTDQELRIKPIREFIG
jgi:hypothetical protein